MRTAVTNICSHFRMQSLSLSWGHVASTTSPRFLWHSTGFQRTTERCSRPRDCRCRSVLTVPLPAMSLSSALLLPLIHTADVSGQPHRAYCKFLELEPQLAIGASLLQDRHCGTVFLLLYIEKTLHTFKWQLAGYLFHFWRADKQKWHSPPSGTVVTFWWFQHHI